MLLGILFANSAGFYVYYIVALRTIHSEMRARLRTLPEEQLSRLVLSRETYEASLVEEDEISLNGKMYDIARIIVTKDAVIAYAMHDEKEEDLMALASEIIAKPFKQDRNVTGSVIHFISLTFLPGQQIKTRGTDGESVAHQTNHTLGLRSLFGQPSAPPPRTNS